MARLPRLSVSKLTLLAGVTAIVATFAFVHDVTSKTWTTNSLPSAGAGPTSTPPAPRADSRYPSDDRGFLHSTARCEVSLTALAVVRTDASLVAICVDPNDDLQYRAVRLSDGATLDVPAEMAGGREFVARNDGVNYSLSAQELVISEGDTLIRREPVIEYRQPHTFPDKAPA